jgi:hypothetical protein
MKLLLAILLLPLLLCADEERFVLERYFLTDDKRDKFAVGYGLKWQEEEWDNSITFKIMAWEKVDPKPKFDKIVLEIGITL